jgi:hypothetical protein
MYASEKVLQMSYANYQFVISSSLVVRALISPRQGKGSTCREVQELSNYGRTGILAAKNISLEWASGWPTRAIPRPNTSTP